MVGLLWCNVGFAQVIKFNCEYSKGSTGVAKYIIDTSKKELSQDFKSFKGEVFPETKVNVLSYNGTVITYEYFDNDLPGQVFRFDYSGDEFLEYQIAPKRKSSMRCIKIKTQTTEKLKTNTDDKIAQAKQICKDLGFKTKTEKFADCSLKMLSMQFEVQNRETSSDGGTQQKIIVNQGYSVGDAMIALSGIISDANRSSSSSGTNCRIFQKHWGADMVCN